MNTDSKATKDLLDRAHFAKTISQGIINSSLKDDNGFVVGLTGKWGSGKSTLLDFLKNDIEDLSKQNEINYALLEFNPWMFTDEENIKKAFLKHLSKGIKSQSTKKISFSRIKKIIAETLGITKIGKRLGGELGENVSTLLEKYLKNDTSISLKKEIDSTLAKLNKKIYIFIDDIDRLFPKQVFEILQILKLSGNFKNTYYIIAFDREAVEICIESQFNEYGKRYLDKIIQVDFPIPEIPSETIENIFFKALEEFTTAHRIEFASRDFISVWSYRGLNKYFTTLRDIYRYFNSLQFRLPAICEDINVKDFLILEAIRLYDSDGYDLIYKKYSRQVMTLESSGVASPAILESFELKQTKALVEYLFGISNSVNSQNSINAKRLANPEYFERYFSLKISVTDIGESDMRIIMELNKNRIGMLASLPESRLKNLLRRINDKSLLEYYNDWDFILISDLFNFFDQYSAKVESMCVQISDAIMNLLIIDESKKLDYCSKFIKLLKEIPSNPSPAREYFYHYILLSEERDTGFANQYYQFKEYYRDHIPSLRSTYISYLENWKNNYLYGVISQSSSFITFLFVFDFAFYKKEEYLGLIDQILKEEKNLFFYLKFIIASNLIDQKPFKINSEIMDLLLPAGAKNSFVNNLLKVNKFQISATENELKEYFLNNI